MIIVCYLIKINFIIFMREKKLILLFFKYNFKYMIVSFQKHETNNQSMIRLKFNN
jgi:hypothetical protein